MCRCTKYSFDAEAKICLFKIKHHQNLIILLLLLYTTIIKQKNKFDSIQ